MTSEPARTNRWRRHGATDPSQAPVAAIVLFGAAAGARGPSAALRARTRRAAELYMGDGVPMVVCAGRPDELEAMRLLLLDAGVPASALREECARTTRETVAAAKRFVGGHRQVIAVSSPYHLPRVLEECRRQELRAIGCPSRLADAAPRPSARLRQRAILLGSRLRELVAVWAYRISWRWEMARRP